MLESPGGLGRFYLCRFLSDDGVRGLASGVVASDPGLALGRFMRQHATALGVGLVEVLDERGETLLARAWSPAPI